MNENFDKFLPILLEKEGYYSAHSWDSGRQTLFGISRRFNSDWKGWKIWDSISVGGQIPQKEKAWDLLEFHVRDLYKAEYWDKVRGDDLPGGIDTFCFDMSVNLGVQKASRLLQREVESYPDGVVGKITLQRVGKANTSNLLDRLCDSRSVYYAMDSDIIARKKAIRGWMRRNRLVYEFSRGLL